MISMLADPNALEHPGLQAYLDAGSDHAVLLSDPVLIEMHKENALSTSRYRCASASISIMRQSRSPT